MKYPNKNLLLNYVRKINISNRLKQNENAIKTFDQIPGPKGVFGFGTFYDYLPGIGKYYQVNLLDIGLDKYKKWGEIVCEKFAPGHNIIWIFNPDDISKLLNNDTGSGVYPQRRSHLALDQYRKDRSLLYKNGGLLPTNGEAWWRLRSELQKGLSSPKHIQNYLTQCDNIIMEFISHIDKIQNLDKPIADFLPELSRLNLELLGSVVFNIRLDCFSENEYNADSRSSKLIESAEITNSCILPTDQGFPIWSYVETPMYKKLRVAQEYMERVAIDLVTQNLSQNNIDEKNSTNPSNTVDKCLLDIYFKNSQLDERDILGMIADLLLAGIDTTSYSTSFLLYHLAMNPSVQEKLYQECLTILPHLNEPLTSNILSKNVTYARAILKESLRINPISVGVGRNANTDIILSGYKVPKGSIIVTQNMISCRLEKYFSDPEKFIPERWLKNNTISTDIINPYLVLPFGHGMRACIARRLAEQNILLFIIRLIRNYKIEWNGNDGQLNALPLLINKPDQPIKIILQKRNN